MNYNHHNRDWWAVWVIPPNGQDKNGYIFPWHLGTQWDESHAENAARANCPLNAERPPILCDSGRKKDEAVARLRRELKLPVI